MGNTVEIVRIFREALSNPSDFQAYQNVPGYWGAPMAAESGGSLWVYYEQSILLRIMEAAEHQRAKPYLRVVYTRSDYSWLSTHPPLSLMQFEPTTVYIPWGADNYGMNDRHAVMGREAADIYFRRWEALATGQARRYLLHESTWANQSWHYANVNPERFLWLHLLDRGITVRRFSPLLLLPLVLMVPSASDSGKQH